MTANRNRSATVRGIGATARATDLEAWIAKEKEKSYDKGGHQKVVEHRKQL